MSKSVSSSTKASNRSRDAKLKGAAIPDFEFATPAMLKSMWYALTGSHSGRSAGTRVWSALAVPMSGGRIVPPIRGRDGVPLSEVAIVSLVGDRLRGYRISWDAGEGRLRVDARSLMKTWRVDVPPSKIPLEPPENPWAAVKIDLTEPEGLAMAYYEVILIKRQIAAEAVDRLIDNLDKKARFEGSLSRYRAEQRADLARTRRDLCNLRCRPDGSEECFGLLLPEPYVILSSEDGHEDLVDRATHHPDLQAWSYRKLDECPADVKVPRSLRRKDLRARILAEELNSWTDGNRIRIPLRFVHADDRATLDPAQIVLDMRSSDYDVNPSYPEFPCRDTQGFIFAVGVLPLTEGGRNAVEECQFTSSVWQCSLADDPVSYDSHVTIGPIIGQSVHS